MAKVQWQQILHLSTLMMIPRYLSGFHSTYIYLFYYYFFLLKGRKDTNHQWKTFHFLGLMLAFSRSQTTCPIIIQPPKRIHSFSAGINYTHHILTIFPPYNSLIYIIYIIPFARETESWQFSKMLMLEFISQAWSPGGKLNLFRIAFLSFFPVFF